MNYASVLFILYGHLHILFVLSLTDNIDFSPPDVAIRWKFSYTVQGRMCRMYMSSFLLLSISYNYTSTSFFCFLYFLMKIIPTVQVCELSILDFEFDFPTTVLLAFLSRSLGFQSYSRSAIFVFVKGKPQRSVRENAEVREIFFNFEI